MVHEEAEQRVDADGLTRRVIRDYPPDRLYDADPNCQHEVVAEWSGVKCLHCRGWFCY